jgi:hypothetical protein
MEVRLLLRPHGRHLLVPAAPSEVYRLLGLRVEVFADQTIRVEGEFDANLMRLTPEVERWVEGLREMDARLEERPRRPGQGRTRRDRPDRAGARGAQETPFVRKTPQRDEDKQAACREEVAPHVPRHGTDARRTLPASREGIFGRRVFIYGRGPALIQYQRSFEDLERFARDPEDPHMLAWQRFNREARSSEAVGIWHETYIVGRGTYEVIYANIPEFGLAKATERVPAIGGRETARRRLMRSENDTETGPSSE